MKNEHKYTEDKNLELIKTIKNLQASNINKINNILNKQKIITFKMKIINLIGINKYHKINYFNNLN